MTAGNQLSRGFGELDFKFDANVAHRKSDGLYLGILIATDASIIDDVIDGLRMFHAKKIAHGPAKSFVVEASDGALNAPQVSFTEGGPLLIAIKEVDPSNPKRLIKVGDRDLMDTVRPYDPDSPYNRALEEVGQGGPPSLSLVGVIKK